MVDRIVLAGIVPESYTDGTGIRFAIFTQGCAHNCPGCHNPETHEFNAGTVVSIDKLMNMIKENPMLDGITLSGGDPLYQVEAACEIAKRAQEMGLNVWCYTGFKYEDIMKSKKMSIILPYIDVLVDGEFIKACRDLSLPFRGSSNQRIIDIKESLKTRSIVELAL